MCVITVADKRRATEEEVEKMAKQNGDGMGIAFREGDVVRWEKGLTLPEMQDFNAKAQLPYVLHFRIATFGAVMPALCHPFPVEREMRSDISGSIKGFVLFHNGTWAAYKEKGIDEAIKNKIKVPEGKWSDTRVMAWLTHMHGHGILELIDEKAILFGIDKIEIFHPDGWFRVNDLLVSNRVWEHAYMGNGRQAAHFAQQDDEAWDYYHNPHSALNLNNSKCRWGNCKVDAVGGGFYCPEHQPMCKMASCQRPRVVTTDWCENHQPLCSETMCDAPRIVGEKLCQKHLAASTKEVGGASTQLVPFRQGEGVVQAGTDHKGSAEGGEEALGPVGGVLPDANVEPPIAPAVLVDSALQAESRWARSINTKRIRTPGVSLMEIFLANQDAHRSRIM